MHGQWPFIYFVSSTHIFSAIKQLMLCFEWNYNFSALSPYHRCFSLLSSNFVVVSKVTFGRKYHTVTLKGNIPEDMGSSYCCFKNLEASLSFLWHSTRSKVWASSKPMWLCLYDSTLNDMCSLAFINMRITVSVCQKRNCKTSTSNIWLWNINHLRAANLEGK